MATSTLPVVLPVNGDDPRNIAAGEVLDGSAKWLDIIGLQTSGILGGALGVDTTVLYSDFVWNKDYLPFGRNLYLEMIATGSLTTTQVQVSLYTLAGVQVTGSVATSTGTGSALARSGAFSLVDGTTYQVHFKSAVLGTATLRLARLIIL